MTNIQHVLAYIIVLYQIIVVQSGPLRNQNGGANQSLNPLTPCLSEKLHSNEEIIECMTAISIVCEDVSKLDHLGKSTAGNDIYALIFTTDKTKYPIDHPNYRRRTSIGLIANMHGNEATGRELLFWLMKNLCENKDNQDDIAVQQLLKNTDIYILPTINPDGFNERYKYNDYYRDNSSENKNGQDMSDEDVDNFAKFWVTGRYIRDKMDMNRNFPALNNEIYKNANTEEELKNNLADSQLFNRTFIEKIENGLKFRKKDLEKETALIINYLDRTPMDFAINFHDGAQVVNYPFDAGIAGKRVYTPTPDDTLYIDTSRVFSYNNPGFLKRNICGESTFNNGITNGAEWYSVQGGLQDYSYVWGGLYAYIS